jgi:hypothetical protein
MSTPATESEISNETESHKSTIATELIGPEKTASDFGDAPDGGTRAWLVAAGGSCVFFSCLGFSNAFGVFQEYYITHQLREETPDRIAWIGSLSAFIQFAAGALGGPLFDRYGAAWVCYLAR